ncbi:molybdopterin-synthase adenylyltransferase MoeB [Fluviibacter phosphoraccumulans]|uniref:molybdopterin-synthase adenylyltransferase MoeB n=1 Tax=Fluviibacter phosphoraccumulans TaxID=1751046 RepID=UPI0010B5A6FC|nr:molybdopterin-synthase adenylyltransferase MoeB [Fluviibacter phosphoraccumulans]BCA64665.1 molybdopterin biosynthesis protein MoeB [Fluviibacter phosphoraccumulans]
MTVRTSDELIQELRQIVSVVAPLQVANDPLFANAIVFDIRDAADVAEGKISGAKTLSQRFIELEIGRYGLPAEQPIVICCYGGRMSLIAAHSLRQLGYMNVYSLEGGFTGWREQGLPTEKPTVLTSAERARYSRHLGLPKVGEAGQIKLKEARVALVGAGGLGSPIAYYLAAAGVGHIRLIDADVVEESNLQRQIIHSTRTVGQPKVESAKGRLIELNPLIEIEAVNARLHADNASSLLAGCEIVVDGSDNFDTRYAVNAGIIANKQILVSASIFQFSGQISVFAPHLGTPCYSCLFPEATPSALSPSCSTAGVIGALAGVVGLLQAMEVLKLVLGIGEPLYGKLLTFDGLTSTIRPLTFPCRSSCKNCGHTRHDSTQVAAAA